MVEIHPQTLRQYEREGLIVPSRSSGGIRLYSLEDIDKIKLILKLTREMGINLAGVDMILKLQNRISELETIVDEIKIENQNLTSNSKALIVKETKFDIVVVEK
jgi:MerR family transcriptional regulator/heat shock protein HspR